MNVMKIKALFVFFWLGLTFSATMPATAAVEQSESLRKFIDEMSTAHQFDAGELKSLFSSVEIKQSILKAMSRPAEAMPWYKYRKIFMTDARIKGGLRFWRENEKTLDAVEKEYGVPPEIITAIIGVETLYGANTGSFRVIDALSTLAFAYPKRSAFFTSELKQFLILCREEQLDPLKPLGSYAGAMGMPQFMPSSYRNFAADFDDDKKRDIWQNPADVIASVANYFVKHQWKQGEAVAVPVSVSGEAYQQALNTDLKPDVTVQELREWQVGVPEQLLGPEKVKLLKFEQEKDHELWAGLHNFYVITRYNHSPLYAMAVFQLSQAIADKMKPSDEK